MFAFYIVLLRLYPSEFRRDYGDEMASVFREARSAARNKHLQAQAAFYCREFQGLLRGLIREHLQSLIGSDPSALFSSRRFAMRTEFRFPRSTWMLMTIILAGVIVAMEKASAIAASLPHSNPQLPPIQPAGYAHLQGLVFLFAITFLLAALSWGVLFALRRSGLHRLTDLNTKS